MIEKLDTLTTIEIADYLNVSYVTVNRWIDRGKIKAYKLPLRGDRRVEVRHFLDFLRENNMPIPSELESQAKRVLIVDDDPEMAKSMSRILINNGFEVKIASDGFSAGHMAGMFQPTVMTLDLMMPGVNGMDVLRLLRSEENRSSIKILVSSGASKQELEEALAAGADDILEKPFEGKDLLMKVNSLAGLGQK